MISIHVKITMKDSDIWEDESDLISGERRKLYCNTCAYTKCFKIKKNISTNQKFFKLVLFCNSFKDVILWNFLPVKIFIFKYFLGVLGNKILKHVALYTSYLLSPLYVAWHNGHCNSTIFYIRIKYLISDKYSFVQKYFFSVR